MAEPKKKDYATAILLNLVIPGAGYLYMGRKVLGVLVMVIMLALYAGYLSTGTYAFGQMAWGLGFIAAIDGYLGVKKYNDGLTAAGEARLIPCPNCAEKIQPEAKVCRFCQREVAKAVG
jgi:hypothetical protein